MSTLFRSTQVSTGTPKQLVFADHAGDFSPTAANDLREPLENRLDVNCGPGLLANGSYWQSDKVDFGEGTVYFPEEYAARGVVQLATTPTALTSVNVWWAPSQSGTAGTANPANASGVDGAYTGYSANPDNAIQGLELIGAMTITEDATIAQVAPIGRFRPPTRYGSLILKNETGAAFSSDVEFHIVFDPVLPEGVNS